MLNAHIIRSDDREFEQSVTENVVGGLRVDGAINRTEFPSIALYRCVCVIMRVTNVNLILDSPGVFVTRASGSPCVK